MSVTSGFFDSLNGDRRYNAAQFSAMFDNLITDGVFVNVGTAFEVKAGTGNGVTVGVGRAWFNSAWVYNDALYSLTAQTSEMLLDRIDAVVIEINHNDAVRSGSIRIVQGSPSSDPVRPVMTNTEEVHQHPLAYIYRKGGSTSITQADITNVIGTSECPYVTGILETQDIDKIVAQWQGEFDNWFDSLDVILEGDVAANLANQVLSLQSQFHSLAKDRAVYEDLQDSTGDTILDSSGAVVEGTTSFDYSGSVTNIYVSGGGGGGDPVTPPSDPGTIDSVFVVGDTLTTTRTNLGDKWLLCNGAQVDRDEYTELSSNVPSYPTGSVSNKTIWTNDSYGRGGVHSICYGDGYYVACGQDADGNPTLYYATSLEGTWTKVDTWSNTGSTNSIRMNTLAKVIYADGYYVAAGSYMSSSYQMSVRIMYATNPAESWTMKDIWTGSTADLFEQSAYFGDITYADGKIIICGYNSVSNPAGSGVTQIAYAENPSAPWTVQQIIDPISPRRSALFPFAILYVDGRYAVFTGKGIGGREVHILTSSTLSNQNWSDHTGPTVTNSLVVMEPYFHSAVAYANGKYVASFGGDVYYSSNGTSGWVSKSVGIDDVYSVCYANKLWLFSNGDTNGQISWITDIVSGSAETRTIISSSNGHYDTIYDIKYINSNYIMSGQASNNARIYYIDDTKFTLPEISLNNTVYTYIKAKS